MPDRVWILASSTLIPLSAKMVLASSTVWPLASNSQATPPSKSMPRLRAVDHQRDIEFFIPTFKNADFTEEDECRLIFSPPPNCPVKPSFRIARGMLVPYYSLKALSGNRQLPITGVTVGSPNRAMNVESVRMMLAANRYAGVVVEASPTPYRA